MYKVTLDLKDGTTVVYDNVEDYDAEEINELESDEESLPEEEYEEEEEPEE
jgi:hypothetical protein